MATRVLILGGTGEAAALAARLAADPRFAVETSLAGRTTKQAKLAGEVRMGGFGGSQGLADHIRSSGAAVLVDATHPFAAQIRANAAEAATAAGVPLADEVAQRAQAVAKEIVEDEVAIEVAVFDREGALAGRAGFL